jgi:hypothetical protein
MQSTSHTLPEPAQNQHMEEPWSIVLGCWFHVERGAPVVCGLPPSLVCMERSSDLPRCISRRLGPRASPHRKYATLAT